ncbi:MAPEG family protein, partial [Shewanella sp. SR41-2]|nr:MAPEG family protein [Shewanella sp. SR41-2]
MQTILICLLIAMLLPYAAKVPLAMAMAKLGRYDN